VSQPDPFQRHYEIIMWDVLSGDFDHDIEPEECFQNVIQHVSPVNSCLSDSLKAETNLRYALPLVLDHFQKKDFLLLH
jgi:hypothetical protein